MSPVLAPDFDYMWLVSAPVYVAAVGSVDMASVQAKLARVEQEQERLSTMQLGSGGGDGSLVQMFTLYLQAQTEQTCRLVEATEAKANKPSADRIPRYADTVQELIPKIEEDCDLLMRELRLSMVTPWVAKKGGDRLLELWEAFDGSVDGCAA